MVRKRAAKAESPPPTTIGEHLKHVRLAKGLLQREVAKEIGVSKDTVANWEKGQTTPPVCLGPRIFDFLGYCLLADGVDLESRMAAYRVRRGLTMDAAASLLGVDPGSWSAWERGIVVPWPRFLIQIERQLRS
ncbi:helix-turn-helix domain-containing protein [Roseateles toxinivorans]|uniref:helix-turn-helix domain-containing protein n=1 Tax=Roseateles toxinivorans TaxID=270368 RepID=UPI003C7CDD9A